jgi:hypothetical protein
MKDQKRPSKMHIPQEKEVVDRLVAWGTAHPMLRDNPFSVRLYG